MPRGKALESEALKNIVLAYLDLTEAEAEVFRKKIFTKMCFNLSKEDKNKVRNEREALLKHIEDAKKVQSQREMVSALSTDELEKILAERKK